MYLSLSAASEANLEQSEDSADSKDAEDAHQSEDGRGELRVRLRDTQLYHHIDQRHSQDKQVKQVPLAHEVVLAKSDNL